MSEDTAHHCRNVNPVRTQLGARLRHPEDGRTGTVVEVQDVHHDCGMAACSFPCYQRCKVAYGNGGWTEARTSYFQAAERS